MSGQVKSYLEDMNKMYKVIMQKCIDNAELNSTEILFLEIYKRTIGVNYAN